MKIEDLIQLLNNRLREFKLSSDYAKMSGDLERMNTADKEIIGLEDTLYQLNLLVDSSKSAAVKETTLTDILTDGSVAVLSEYDITSYATDPLHEEKILTILSNMGIMDTVEKIDAYIKDKYLSSPVTGEMIMSASLAYIVDTRLMMAIMQQDSSFGTAGKAVSTLNPGNVGNNDDGDTVTYESWQEGVTAVARWLSRHRIVKDEEVQAVATTTPAMATTTPVTATSTPTTTTSTTTTATTTPATATSTDEIIPIIISTTTTSTTTPTTATSTPVTSTSTEETAPIVISTTTTSTTTPAIATSTPETTTSTEETAPVVTSTTTTTSTTTPATATTIDLSSLQDTVTQETATTTAN